MSKSSDGGPAFPQPMAIESTGDMHHSVDWAGMGGMTLRDHFAGQALAGQVDDHGAPEQTAAWAYGVADAMLKARKGVKACKMCGAEPLGPSDDRIENLCRMCARKF